MGKWAVLFAVFFLVSCFPEEKSQQSGSIEQQMQVQQTTAVSYARMFQQYAALSQQYLMKDVWEEGVATIPADGLIGSQIFANLYNVTKASEFLESAYCDMGARQYHVSWFKGDVNTSAAGAKQGGIVISPKDLKGIGKGGYGGIMRVMSREMSPRSYGTYEEGQVKLGDGTSQVMTCAAMQYIPVGTPVILSAIKQNTSEQQREYYRYTSVPCGAEDQRGIIRSREKWVITYNENGKEISDTMVPDTKPEVVMSACQTDPGTPAIAIETNSADVVDFASAGLSGTVQANCFEATQIDASGNPVLDEKGEEVKFSNCEGSDHNYNPDEDLPPGQQLSCETTPLRTETRQVPCSGDGWSGNATYQRQIFRCEVLNAETGQSLNPRQFYEEAREWSNQSIYCSRPEETYFFCPSSDGTLRYSRTNVINSFVPGTFNPAPPTDPSWNYASGTCDVNVRDCSPRYVGQDRVANASMPGSLSPRGATNPHNMPGAQINPISTLCGSGSICTEIRDGLACPVDNMAGSRTEERTYTCTGSNAGSWSHPAAPAPWQEVANTCNCTIWAQTNFGMQCSAAPTGLTPACPANTDSGYGSTCPTVGATCYNSAASGMPGSTCPEGQMPFETQTLQCQNYTDAASCGCTEQQETRISGQPGAPVCGAGQTGSITEKRIKSCPSGAWGDWEVVSNTCGCGAPYTRDIPGGTCPAGQTGTITHHQTKNPATCAWQTTGTTNTCASCGTNQLEWQRVGGAQTCVRPGGGNRWCGNEEQYPYSMCGSGGQFFGGGACGVENQRCNTRAEYLDAGACTSCTSPYITYIMSYTYEIWECKRTTGATCCTPYSQPVASNPNVCPAGEQGRSSITYDDYSCNASNQQTGPTQRTEYTGTCSPIATPPTCTNGDIRNATFCPAPNQALRSGYEECVNNNWVPRTDQTCPGVTQCMDNGVPFGVGSFQVRGVPCPSGQTGSIDEQRTCQSNGSWTAWSETGRTCVATCTPTWVASNNQTLMDVGRNNAVQTYYNETQPGASPPSGWRPDIRETREYVQACTSQGDAGNIKYTYDYSYICTANYGSHYCDHYDEDTYETLEVCQCN